MLRRLVVFGLFCLLLRADPPAPWTLARSPHFTIYSQAGPEDARSALMWFESLRAFFLTCTGYKIDDSRKVFIVGFRSAEDYAPYRLNDNADAFYVGEEGRDYIVLPALSGSNYRLAAHEYAHLVLHSAALHLPLWLSEGLAEYLSTIEVGGRRSDIGGDLPGRSQTLAHETWIPLAALLVKVRDPATSDSHREANLFYSESWLLADMLVRSPRYAAEFPKFLETVASGDSSEQALNSVYGRSINTVAVDLENWAVTRPNMPISLQGVLLGHTPIDVSEASSSAPRAILAQILLASGELGRAKKQYLDLERDDPSNGDAPAALASIALMERDLPRALAEWQKAMKIGITDPELCFRFAVRADTAGVDAEEIRQALRRAVALDPAFDDCRYRLALSEHNAGNWEESIAQLRAMHTVDPQRTFVYWITMASALESLDRRDEAIAAARKALDQAVGAYQESLARELIFFGQTDLKVRFTHRFDGKEEMETTRIPHNAKNWNPFIEPGETILHAEGTLSDVRCAGGLTGLVVHTSQGELSLRVPDPHRVQITNVPPQLACGNEQSARVKVDYVQQGAILRGLEFTR